jgi:hypothetical protein
MGFGPIHTYTTAQALSRFTALRPHLEHVTGSIRSPFAFPRPRPV